ncbi:MAG: FKBP-type peptidyl-prolyl cis-trans isomerase [Promethearchaeota archaeon]
MKIQKGDVVLVEYIISEIDDTIIDSSEISNGGPIKIQVGYGQVFRGFDQALIDMEVGETKEVILSPELAFGEYDPILLEKVPRSQFPKDKEIPIGKLIEYVGPNGMSSPAWIRLVEDDFVIIDMNHPLAGKEIKLTIKVIDSGLEPDPIPNPFYMGISCEGACEHDHNEK